MPARLLARLQERENTLRPNKAKRSAAKKTTGKRLKPKPVDPKLRAKRRLAQAQRALLRFASGEPQTFLGTKVVDANLARIARILEAFPELAPNPAAA